MMNPRIVLAVLVTTICLFAPDLRAQMSGNYTINPKGTGSRNFTSFSAAVVQLWKSGMSGAVSISAEPGNYTETVMLSPITGMSTTNTLTFKSRVPRAAVFTSLISGGFVFDLSTASKPIRGVVLDGFTFATNGIAILTRTPTEDLEIKNCAVAKAPARGIELQKVKRVNIHHCLFDEAYRPLRLTDYSACQVHHNEVRIGEGRDGMFFTAETAGTVAYTRVYDNNITSLKRCSPGINISYYAYGIEMTHNTIVVNSSSGGCASIVGYTTRPTRMWSNILVNLGTSYVLQVDSTNSYTMQLDGNLYYAGSQGWLIGSYRGQRPKWSLAAWQKLTGLDQKSINANPLLKGLGVPFDLRPSASSPAIGKAVNTPAYVVDDFAGTPRRRPSTIGSYEGTGSSFVAFGKGCPGSGFRTPVSSHGGDLRMGSTSFSLILSNALGGSSVRAFLTVGAVRQTIPLGGGCNLLVAPQLTLPMTMGGTTGAGNGVIIYRINLPSDPKLKGAKAHFQWGVVDSAAAGIGLALSQGSTLTL